MGNLGEKCNHSEIEDYLVIVVMSHIYWDGKESCMRKLICRNGRFYLDLICACIWGISSPLFNVIMIYGNYCKNQEFHNHLHHIALFCHYTSCVPLCVSLLENMFWLLLCVIKGRSGRSGLGLCTSLSFSTVHKGIAVVQFAYFAFGVFIRLGSDPAQVDWKHSSPWA